MPDRQVDPIGEIDEFLWIPPEDAPTDELYGGGGRKTFTNSTASRRRDLVVGAVGLTIGLVLGLAVSSIGGPTPDGPEQYPAEQTGPDEGDARHADEANLRRSLTEANEEIARLRRDLRTAKTRARVAAARAARARERGSNQKGQPPVASPFMPPSGWTTDALTPGYTGCRQGYPGGRINGVYVWKPIPC